MMGRMDQAVMSRIDLRFVSLYGVGFAWRLSNTNLLPMLRAKAAGLLVALDTVVFPHWITCAAFLAVGRSVRSSHMIAELVGGWRTAMFVLACVVTFVWEPSDRDV